VTKVFIPVRQEISFQLIKLSLFALAAILTLVLWATFTEALGQKSRTTISRAQAEVVAVPLYRDYKGIQLGELAEDVHKKLGVPAQSDPAQDFYIFSETETAQFFYDSSKKVTAISVDYLTTGSGVPDYKQIVGADIETRADGSMYKLVRYPKAGFWVSYNRTPGTAPLVTVTIQKISQ
jgi:hypothetical protein